MKGSIKKHLKENYIMYLIFITMFLIVLVTFKIVVVQRTMGCLKERSSQTIDKECRITKE